MPIFRIIGFNDESKSILHQVGGGIVHDDRVATMVYVPEGTGFVYLHKEVGVVKSYDEGKQELVLLPPETFFT